MGELDFKRLSMRSWRRGTKEMDMILGPFSDAHLRRLDREELIAYEALLSENDQDLYQWVSRQAETPKHFRQIMEKIRSFAEAGPP